MVKITIYLEGDKPNYALSQEAEIVGDFVFFRKFFGKLFRQKFSIYDVDISIRPIGSVSQAPKYLQKITEKNLEAVLLIDLDASKSKKQKRIEDNYKELDTSKLFFMIQGMEAWILSQPQKIIEFAESQGLERLKPNVDFLDRSAFQKHPENISHPDKELARIFKKFYKEHDGSKKLYSKTKDGPILIGLLNLNELANVFDELKNLLDYLESRTDTKN